MLLAGLHAWDQLRDRSILKLLTAFLLAGSMWFYVAHVLVPHQVHDALVHGKPRGNLSDLYPRWLGARELLLNHRNPYSSDITRDIQAGYYGRPLDLLRVGDPKDQQAFAYPVYVVFLLAPTIYLPFPLVQKVFFWFLLLLTAASVVCWFYVLRWRTQWSTALLWIVLTLGSVPVVQGLKLQQLSLLVAGLLAISAAALVRGHLAVAGSMLGFATIKPQLAWLPVAWLLLWTCRDWGRRQRFFWGFAGTMIVLLTAAELVLPGWTRDFRAAVDNYLQYTNNVSVLGLLLTPWWGMLAGIALLVVMASWCWPLSIAREDHPDFGAALAVVFAATVVVIPMFAPYNQLLLLPGLMVVGRQSHQLWGTIASRLLLILAAVVLLWPWAASLALSILVVLRPPRIAQDLWAVPFYTELALPLVAFGLLLVYLWKYRKA